MCGRFALQASPEQVKAIFSYEETPNFPPRLNIAPTEPIAIIVKEGGARHFRLMRWGFLPAWVKDPKDFPLLINARSETLHDKPAFRNAVKHRRALVPADAFYEWKREGTIKQPYRIAPASGGVFAIAALWETYADQNGSEMDTATLITCAPNAIAGTIHDRMPAILAPAQFDLWLDHAGPADAALRLLGPAPGAWVAEPLAAGDLRIHTTPARTAKQAPAKPAATKQAAQSPRPKPTQGELF